MILGPWASLAKVYHQGPGDGPCTTDVLTSPSSGLPSGY